MQHFWRPHCIDWWLIIYSLRNKAIIYTISRKSPALQMPIFTWSNKKYTPSTDWLTKSESSYLGDKGDLRVWIYEFYEKAINAENRQMKLGVAEAKHRSIVLSVWGQICLSVDDQWSPRALGALLTVRAVDHWSNRRNRTSLCYKSVHILSHSFL